MMNNILKFAGLSLSLFFLAIQPANAIINCWTPDDSKELAKEEGYYLWKSADINTPNGITKIEVWDILEEDTLNIIQLSVVYKTPKIGETNRVCWSYEIETDLIKDLELPFEYEKVYYD